MHPCLAGSPGGPGSSCCSRPGPQLPREQRQQTVGLCCAGEEDTEGGEDPLEKCSGPSPVPESGQLPSGSHSHCRVGGETLPSHLHLTFPKPVGSESESDSALLFCISLPTASGLSPALLGHSACPSLSQLSHSLRPPRPALPYLVPSHSTNPLSPHVSCLLMSLCLFCFPCTICPFFPLPSPQCAGPSGRLGEGRWVGGGGKPGLLFTFVSQRTWENCSLSRGGLYSSVGSPPPPHRRAPATKLPSLSPPLLLGGGHSELGRGLSGL